MINGTEHPDDPEDARDVEPPFLVLTGHTPDGNRIDPEDWAERLTDMAGAYTQPRSNGHPQVLECRACPDRTCVRIGRSVAKTHPGLFTDLLLFAQLAQAMDYTAFCPRLKPTRVVAQRREVRKYA
ncbi:MAG: hypothetical protein B7Z66_11120 [Chromatiales bacterium 21-64-14]|nr:MAG: hypothetical protein B7Z66_11120 [Chromatiales bacterium 21-64-14]HQU16778.1 DUF3579 domain-containing protein [Gammaproteobacteria bacterium]